MRNSKGQFIKGHIVLEDTKRAVSFAQKGKKHTEEWKKNMRKIMKEKVKENNFRFKKGQIPWNKGLGNITPENIRIRKSVNCKIWRKACFERDNFTCQVTGKYGGNLIVHHINNFADFPELRFAIDNGITMEKNIHDIFHKQYGYKNNTKEQLSEFVASLAFS